MNRPLCEICETDESTPAADPYDDLELCPFCRADLDEQREERFMREWLGFDFEQSAGPEVN